MQFRDQIILNLKATYSATNKNQRQEATNFLKRTAEQNAHFIIQICQILNKQYAYGDENKKQIQIAASNFILKFCSTLQGNMLLMNERREILVKLFYEMLNSNEIIHRFKASIVHSFGKLLLGTWGKQEGLGQKVFKQTLQVLKQGKLQLTVYLLHTMLSSDPQFSFVGNVKQHILSQYLRQLNLLIKHFQIQMQQNKPQQYYISCIHIINYGLQVLLQYLSKITVERYRPLLKQILHNQILCQIVLNCLSITPINNNQLFISKQVPFAQKINNIRIIIFDLICYLLVSIVKSKIKLTSIKNVNQMSQQIFVGALQKLPSQLNNALLDENKYYLNKVLKFIGLLIKIIENNQFILLYIEEITCKIALPLILIPQNVHQIMNTNVIDYIGYFEQIISQKKQSTTYTGHAIKIIQNIVFKVDGALKQITSICLEILINCIDSNNTININNKLITSQFFKATPNARFESSLLLLTALAYKISSRNDLIQELENFIIRYEKEILSINDRNVIFMFELFYMYYTELFFNKKDLKQHMKVYFSYFLLISKTTQAQNKAIRIQSFQTLQNIIQQNNFKSFFLQDISTVIDEIVNNSSPQLDQIINLFTVALKQFAEQIKFYPDKVTLWLSILEKRINQNLQSNKSTLIFARYLSMLQQIITDDVYYTFRDQAIQFFVPCLHLLDFKNQYSENVLDVIKSCILALRSSPSWTLIFMDKLILLLQREQKLSVHTFGVLNVLLIYIQYEHRSQISKIFSIISNKLISVQQNQDILQAILLGHLLVFYHYQQLTDYMKSDLVNKTIRLLLQPEIFENRKTFSKLVLLILLMLKQQFQFTTLLLEAHNDFLDAFYNMVYNIETYCQEYDYKVFIIIQSSIINNYWDVQKQRQYFNQSFSIILQFLQKLYLKTENIMSIEKNSDFGSDEESQQKIQVDQKSYDLIQSYISPLKQIDQWNNFKGLIANFKKSEQKWQTVLFAVQTLSKKQQKFFNTTALNIQKMNIGGQTKLRNIVKIKRPL